MSSFHRRYVVALGFVFVLAACGGVTQSDLSNAGSQPSASGGGGGLSSSSDSGVLESGVAESGVPCSTWTTQSDCDSHGCSSGFSEVSTSFSGCDTRPGVIPLGGVPCSTWTTENDCWNHECSPNYASIFSGFLGCTSAIPLMTVSDAGM